MSKIRLIVAAFALLIASAHADASPCAEPSNVVRDAPSGFSDQGIDVLFEAFETAADAGCYEVTSSPLPFVNEVERILTNQPSTNEPRERMLQTVAAIEQALGIVTIAIANLAPSDARDVFRVVVSDYRRALDNVDTTGVLPAELGYQDSFVTEGGVLEFSYARDGESFPLGIQERVWDACNTTPFSQSQCLQAVDTANADLTVYQTLGRINDVVVDPRFEQLLTDISLIDSRWTAYFDRARVQNIAETFVNNTLGRQKLDNQTGFAKVPESQWVTLHPSIALEYIDGAASNDQFAQAMVVELVGKDMWTFADNSAEMKRYWGVSVIGAYSNRGSVDEIGYGLMVHWNRRFSIGATTRDDDTSIFISIDLQDLLFNWDDKRKQRLRSFESFDAFRNDLRRCVSASGQGCQLTSDE